MPLGFPNAYQRINEISGVTLLTNSSPGSDYSFKEVEKTKEGPKGERETELLELCSRWHAVPASYELADVVKQGDHAIHTSHVTEIWKGVYGGEVIVLKVLRVSQGGDPDVQKAQQVSNLYIPHV